MALSFFWRCEGTTLSGTDDFTDGDSTATANSTAAINSDTVRVGTNSHDCSDGDDYFSFDISASDLLDASVGSAAFWYYANSLWQSGQTIWQAVDASSTSDHIYIQKSGSAGTGGLSLDISSSTGGNTSVATGDISLTTGNWYFVIIKWHASNQDGRIEVYNTSLSSLGSNENLSIQADHFPSASVIDSLRLGHQSGTSEAGSFDNYFIADDYSEDLIGNATITSYTQYGGTSVAPLSCRHLQNMMSN